MVANLGMGVMIGMLAGNDESAKAMQAAIGKRITALTLTDDSLRIELADGSKLKLEDAGQSCCEHRYTSFIVIHDTRNTWFAGVDEVLDSFKFRFDYCFMTPVTTVVSNKYDVSAFG